MKIKSKNWIDIHVVSILDSIVLLLSVSDSKLEQNQAAGFLTLLRHMLHTSSTNRDTFTRINAAATIGAILQKVKHM